MKNRDSLRTFLLTTVVAVGVFLLDQFAKWSALRSGPHDIVPGILAFRIYYNTGIALSIPLGSWILIILMVLAFVLVTHMFLQALRAKKKFASIAYGLLLGGAVSNIFDRLWLGSVVDYIEIAHLSIFNLADVAIISGLLVFFFMNWKDQKQAPAA